MKKLAIRFKKLSWQLIFLTMFFFSSFGTATSQVLYQGNVVVDTYYGFPNFGKAFLNLLIDSPANNIKGIGPWGVRLEYMLGEEFGITLNAIHNSFTSTDRITYDEFGDNDEIVYTTYYHSLKMDRLRVQLGMNYHFGFDNPLLDTYIGIAAGTNHRRMRYDFDNDPAFDGMPLEDNGVLIPVSMRLSAGGRYFFSDNIGVNFEIGLGGPLLSAGFSLRF